MMEALLAGLFGLLIGSFLNVCIYRMPRDLSVVRPRSHCPSCQQTIAWHDNIPVVSYMLLRGRCRACGAGIPMRYPLVELVTGACFGVAVWVLGPTLMAAKLCVFSAILIALFFSDLEERILPDEFTLGGTVAGILLAAFIPLAGIGRMFLPEANAALVSVVESAFAAGFSALTLWGVGALYQKLRHREGLGLGDVKMVAMIGAFLGLNGVLLTLMAGSMLGAAVGLVYISISRKDASTYELPFGSFLAVAALLVAFYGNAATAWWGGLGG